MNEWYLFLCMYVKTSQLGLYSDIKIAYIAIQTLNERAIRSCARVMHVMWSLSKTEK